MNCNRSLCVAMLLVPVVVMADQIVLKNGDRVTGSIVSKDPESLKIKTLHFGEVTTKWEHVESITTDTPVSVVLPGGKTIKGLVATTADGRLEVTAEGEAGSAPLAEVEALRDDAEQKAYERLLRPRILDLWTVNGSFSVAGATGNAKTFTFVVPFTAVRTTRNDKITGYFNLIRSSALVSGLTETTANAVRGGWAYNRNLHRRVFWTVFDDYEFDRFQNLDLRVVVGSGFGVSVWQGESSRLELLGGLAWNRESFDPVRPQEPFVRHAFEGFWGNNLLLRLSESASLTQSYRMFNTLKGSGGPQEGGFRQNLDLTLNMKLARWLTWNAAITDRFLQKPVPGREKNDLVYATGLGFSISR